MDDSPNFEMIPIRDEPPGFFDRLLASNESFRRLLEARRRQSDAGRTSPLDDVRRRLSEA